MYVCPKKSPVSGTHASLVSKHVLIFLYKTGSPSTPPGPGSGLAEHRGVPGHLTRGPGWRRRITRPSSLLGLGVP